MDSVIQGDRMRVPPPPSAYNDRDTCKCRAYPFQANPSHARDRHPTTNHSLDSEADSKSRALDQFGLRFVIMSLSAGPLPFSSTPSVRVIPHTAAAAPVYDEQHRALPPWALHTSTINVQRPPTQRHHSYRHSLIPGAYVCDLRGRTTCRLQARIGPLKSAPRPVTPRSAYTSIHSIYPPSYPPFTTGVCAAAGRALF